MGRTRRRTPLLLVLGGLGVLLLLAGVLAVRVLVPPQRTPVAALPDDASPTEVVRTYLEALDSHDCARARSLWEDGGGDADVEGWCRDLAGVDDVRVGDASVEPEEANPGTQEVVAVPVTFSLDHRPFHGDSSMQDVTVWGYSLTRATGPWRIVDQGTG